MTAGPRLGLGLALAPFVVVLAFAVAQAAGASSAAEGYERAMAVIIVAGVGIAALAVRPAAAISGALVLGLFQSRWDQLGSSIDLDRYAMLLAIGSVLVREWRHRDGRLQTRPIDWLLILTSIYALSSLWLANLFEDDDARFELIDRFGLIPFALFFVAPFAFRTEADRNILLGTLIGIGTYLGITSILETTGPKALVWPQYILDPNQGIHADRARGPFVDAGANGIVLYSCAVAAIIAAAKWRDRRWRIFALCVAGLCLLGVLLALTRAVWIAAAVASPLALAAVRETRRLVVPAVAAAALIMTVALATIPGLADRVDRRRNDTNETFWLRKNSNAAAVRMVQDRPLIGFGWGRFEHDSPEYYRQSQDYPLNFLRNLHNVFLQNAVELGLLGTFLWIVGLLWAIAGGVLMRGPPELRAWKLGLLATAVAQLIAYATTPAEYIMPTLLLWLWAGLCWGQLDGRRARPRGAH